MAEPHVLRIYQNAEGTVKVLCQHSDFLFTAPGWCQRMPKSLCLTSPFLQSISHALVLCT